MNPDSPAEKPSGQSGDHHPHEHRTASRHHSHQRSVERHPAPAHRGPHSGRHWRPWLIGGAVVLVVGLAVILLFRHADAKKKAAEDGKRKSAPIPVSIAAVKQGDIGVHLDALGIVTPQQNVTIKSRVDGALVAVHFTEGQMVKQGDLLAELDPTPFRAALKQSEGQLARDEAQLKNARLDLQRYRNVLQQHAIPEQQVQTQEALVQQDEGTVTLDQGSVDNARAQLAYTKIRAPLDGRVGLRLVDVGNMVHAADTTGLLVITEMVPITVVFSIPEDQLGEVATEFRKGAPMPVEAWDRDQHTRLATGTLLTIDNQIDATTGTIKLKALFSNDQEELFPNQFVNAKLLVRTVHNAELVPVPAIQHTADKTTVFVVGGDHKVQDREITVVTMDGATAAITGVDAGDSVVTDGFDKLQAGSLVEVKSGADESNQGLEPQQADGKTPAAKSGQAAGPGGK